MTKRRLCIGIYGLDSSWQAILDHLGFWFEEVDFSSEKLSNSYSIIILIKTPGAQELSQFEKFIGDGGAVLEINKSRGFTQKEHLSRASVKTLLNQSYRDGFNHLKHLDLFTQCTLHSDSDILEGLVHIETLKNGFVGFLGVDFPRLIEDQRYTRKRFYHTQPPYPDEIVSTISKQELFDCLNSLITELHVLQSLPIVQKWTSPKKKPIFSFRIDSDFGDKTSIHELYEFLKSHNIRASWFLHVEAHENWLEQFKEFENQEIALHGYEHGTSNSAEKIERNIERGLAKLIETGIEAEGFCAPYGIWNAGLKTALQNFRFSYTSEFTFAYDGLPIQHKNMPLQIPVHPICTGSLSRKEYSESEMELYFNQMMKRKSGRFEPVVFYHHPLQTGFRAFESVFKAVENGDFTNLTFREMAEFWKSRKACSFEAFYDLNKVQVLSNSDKSQLIQVSFSHDQFDLLKGEGQIDLKKTPDFHYTNTYLPDPKVISEIRKNDFRLIKTSLLDWKNRIQL